MRVILTARNTLFCFAAVSPIALQVTTFLSSTECSILQLADFLRDAIFCDRENYQNNLERFTSIELSRSGLVCYVLGSLSKRLLIHTCGIVSFRDHIF